MSYITGTPLEHHINRTFDNLSKTFNCTTTPSKCCGNCQTADKQKVENVSTKEVVEEKEISQTEEDTDTNC